MNVSTIPPSQNNIDYSQDLLCSETNGATTIDKSFLNTEEFLEETVPDSQLQTRQIVDESFLPTFTLHIFPKCSHYGCKGGDMEMFTCCANGCERKMHKARYSIICVKNSLPILEDNQMFCTKLFHQKYMRQLKRNFDKEMEMPNLAWGKDGKFGPNDVNTSLSVLTNWWTMEGNYVQFHGNNNRCIETKLIAEKLAEQMGKIILCQRMGDSFLGKIQHIERSWGKAHDWANCTVQGVSETNPEGFEAEVRKRCRC